MNAPPINRVLTLLKKPGALYIVFISILISFWPLTTFRHTLKWDALDISLPWRLFVNDCLQNLLLPLWNPFQHHGFPIGYIPETWYPVPSLLGFLFGYNLFCFNLEFLLHLIIASWGFYRLCRAIGLKTYSSIFASLIFPLSGFFTANAQHLGWIVAAAWIPHVIYAYLEFRNKQQWKYGFEFVLYYFLLLSGGYPAYSIVITYIIIILAATHLIRTRGSWSNFSFGISRQVQLLVLVGIIGSVLWISFYEMKIALLRGSGISESELLEGSFRFIHLLSLSFPWSTIAENETFWMADQSMISIYLGIPVLGLIVLSFFLLHKSFVKWSWVFTLLFLSISLATELPLRRWLNVLPFFDLFRFSSLFRLFTEMGLILIASKALEFVVEEKKYLFLTQKVFISLGVLFLILYLGSTISLPGQFVFQSDAAQNLKSNISRESLVNMLISTFLFIGCLKLSRHRIFPFFFIISFTDLFLTVQINGRTSVFSSEPFSELSACIATLPKGFPVPGQWANIGSMADRDLQTGAFYRNTNTMYKRIGWDGYIPYQFTVFDSLEKSSYYEKVLDLPPIFLSGLNNDTLSEGSFISFPELNFMFNDFDIENFDPNSWTLNVTVNAPKLLVVNQNFYPGWKAMVNGEKVELRKIDRHLISVPLYEGENQVEVRFIPGRLINGIIITTAGLLLLLIWLSWRYWGYQGSIIIWLFILFIAGKWAYLHFEKDQTTIEWDLPDPNPVILNLVDEKRHTMNTSDITITRYLSRYDSPDYYQRIANLTTNRFYFINRSTCLLDADEIINEFNFSSKRIIENSDYICLEVEKGPSWEGVVSTYSFEHPAKWWSNFYEGRKYDKVHHTHFQEISGERKYSSTFEIPMVELPDSLANLFITATCNGENLSEALLVCSAHLNNETIYWNVHRLGDFMISTSGWNDVTLRAELKEVPRQGSLLRVYIWNPGAETILVKKFEISASVR